MRLRQMLRRQLYGLLHVRNVFGVVRRRHANKDVCRLVSGCLQWNVSIDGSRRRSVQHAKLRSSVRRKLYGIRTMHQRKDVRVGNARKDVRHFGYRIRRIAMPVHRRHGFETRLLHAPALPSRAGRPSQELFGILHDMELVLANVRRGTTLAAIRNNVVAGNRGKHVPPRQRTHRNRKVQRRVLPRQLPRPIFIHGAVQQRL